MSDVRTRILNAAFNQIAERGVGELTQPRVAKAAGVRTSHLTYYFPTRNDLLIEVARFTVQTLVNGFRENLAHAPAKVSSLIEMLNAAVTNKRVVRVLLTLNAASEEDSAIKESVRELIRSERGHLADTLTSAGLTFDDRRLLICHTLLAGTAVMNLARDNAESAAEARAIVQFAVTDLLQNDTPAAPAKVRAAKKRPARKARPSSRAKHTDA